MTKEKQRIEMEENPSSILLFPATDYGLGAIAIGACGVYCHYANVQYHDLPLSLPLIGASAATGLVALLFGAASAYHKAKEKKQEQKDNELKLIEAVRKVYSKPATEESKVGYDMMMPYLGKYMDNLR